MDEALTGIMQLSYVVDASMSKENVCEVTLTVDDFPDDVMNVVIPSWVPGSYVIRDYARTVRDFSAVTVDGKQLPVRKKDKGTWSIFQTRGLFVRITYSVYSGDLIPQMSHIDDSHVYLLGADLFAYLDGYKEQSTEVEFRLPENSRLITSLDEVSRGKYRTTNYDALVDSVTEIGNPAVSAFTLEGKEHELVFCGFDHADTAKITSDTKKIVETVTDMFQYIPYKKYTFFFHLTDSEGGSGHEHASSCSMTVGKPLLEGDKYGHLLSLIAHEFFHAYNVKRIRPAEFEKFNYREENYTSLLWFSEGFTSYYGELVPARAGIIDEKAYMGRLVDSVRLFELMPGRRAVSAASSSFDAWIRLYRPSPDDINTYISYYQKGSFIALLLNLRILQLTGAQKSLDDLMRLLWEHYRKTGKGFTEKDLLSGLKEVTGNDFSAFFEKYVNGTEDMDFDGELEVLGYKLVRHRYGETSQQRMGSCGLLLRNENGKIRVVTPIKGYPAYGSGISPGDEVVSYDDVPFTQECTVKVNPRSGTSPLFDLLYVGDADREVLLRVARRGRIREYRIMTADPPVEKYDFEKIEGEKYRKLLNKLLMG